MKTQKILIVDKDVGCRIAMEKVFQIYGYEIFYCGSGQQAVLKLKEEVFDILISAKNLSRSSAKSCKMNGGI